MYKMKCPFCNNDMIYIKDEELEKLGWISMDCPKCPDDRNQHLVPKENPYLECIDDKNIEKDELIALDYNSIMKDLKSDKYKNMQDLLENYKNNNY